MTERPILFSAPMVRAILEGRKTQTRRIIKPQPEVTETGYISWRDEICAMDCFASIIADDSPYGVPGDRLWVRETCRAYEITNSDWNGYSGHVPGTDGVVYAVDVVFREIENTQDASDAWVALYRYRGKRGATVPPIHMPRWASRIDLLVKAVRVERLQDISDDDAFAEGIVPMVEDGALGYSTPQNIYRELWESINGPGSWDANPWVWVVEFQRITP